jgi:hypothetical protein
MNTDPDIESHLNQITDQQFGSVMREILEQAQHQFMINGRTMTWNQWLDELAPGEANPMRSYLTLRFGSRSWS